MVLIFQLFQLFQYRLISIFNFVLNIITESENLKLYNFQETVDACVGTSISVGTVTEPDCFGPCEPGTHVNLEGIVWNEIEGK